MERASKGAENEMKSEVGIASCTYCSKNNRRKDKSCNNGCAAHDHAPFREAVRRQAYQIALIINTTLQGPPRSASVQQSSDIDPCSGAATLHSAWGRKNRMNTMLRLIAAAGLALLVTTSAQAITPAPLPQPDGMVTQVRLGCGPFRTRVNGVCVARTTIRHTRRMARRAYRRGAY